MARLTAQGVGSLGLGTPIARYGLLAVMLLNTMNGAVIGYLGSHNPVGFVPYALMAIASLLLTEQSERRLSPLRAGALIGCVLLAGAVVLVTDVDELHPQIFVASLLVLGLLAVRGNVTAPLVAAGGSVLVAIGWAITYDIAPVAAVVRFLALVAVPLGYLWRFQAVRLAQRERRYRSAAARAEFAAQATREADGQAAAELRLVGEEAMDVLTRLRDGLGVEQAELVITEASIRDRIRAPQLQNERLRRAVRAARGRGVRVLEMGRAADLGPPISTALASTAAEILDRTDRGEVTIRVLPARHTATLTVLVEAPVGTEFHVLDQDGRRVPHL